MMVIINNVNLNLMIIIIIAELIEMWHVLKMRISDQQRLQNRDKIIDTAARLYRERGFDGVGVADIMKEAGFTHGGFYNHFKSKEELIEAALRRAFENLEKETRGKDLSSIVSRYLSKGHRDDLAHGCPASTLGSDTARQSDLAKDAYEEGVETWLSMISEAMAREKSLDMPNDRKSIIALFSKIVGAVVLARSCPADSKLRDEILEACSLPKAEKWKR